ncbi:MAG TPA: response regulator, partial [Anaerolineaceae bacterium]|nr:response regulator [Anaerolineaceae bacterium]
GSFEVSTAQGGEEGLASLQTNRPDAIILDLFMPGINGFALLEKMRTNPDLAQIPVLILTGADLTKEQQQMLSDFGQSMLHKGLLRENELLAALEEALHGTHQD